jgi:hypothetical protein
MSEKIKQIDPAGLLNEDCSDTEMDTQDQPSANIEHQEPKKKPVHHVSSSGEEEEEEDVVNSAAAAAAAAADTHPPNTAAGNGAVNAAALPENAAPATNPGFRIVDIEPNGSGSGLSFQPMQTAQTVVNMNVNKETGVPTHNPPPQLPDPAATSYCTARLRVRYRVKASPVHPRNSALLSPRQKSKTGMEKILNQEVKVTKMKTRSKKFLPA